MLVKSVDTPYCWVCNAVFDDSTNKRHDHHIIPRAYGGVDGPTVSICNVDHSVLHEMALKLYSSKPINQFLSGDKSKDNKLIWLAQTCLNARLATENDPNKSQLVVLNLKRESSNHLNKLKQLYPKLSKKRIIELAIKALHDRNFQQ